MVFPSKIDIAKVEEPEWLKQVAQDSYLNRKDVSQLLGIKPPTLDIKVKAGEFPQPDTKDTKDRMFGSFVSIHKNLWKVSSIRAWFKQNKENKRC